MSKNVRGSVRENARESEIESARGSVRGSESGREIDSSSSSLCLTTPPSFSRVTAAVHQQPHHRHSQPGNLQVHSEKMECPT